MTTKAQDESHIPGINLRRSFRTGPYRSGGNHLTKVVWSPDGQILAVPTQEGAVELWNPDSGLMEREIGVRIGTWIPTVAWSPDSRYIAAGSGDGFTRLWWAATGERYVPRGVRRNTLKGSICCLVA